MEKKGIALVIASQGKRMAIRRSYTQAEHGLLGLISPVAEHALPCALHRREASYEFVGTEGDVVYPALSPPPGIRHIVNLDTASPPRSLNAREGKWSAWQ